MAENKVEGHRDQQCRKLCCIPAAHYVTFAVFNHTHPHARTKTTTEASVEEQRSGYKHGLEASLLGFGLRAL